MDTRHPIIALWPRWTLTVGDMLKARVLVRTQCRRCGALMRVDLDEVAAHRGRSWSLIDCQERCRMVSCDGAAFYVAARGYGASWRTLLADRGVAEGIATLPPVRTAHDLRAQAAEEAG